MWFVIFVKMVLCFCCRFFRGLFVRLREAPPCAILASRASCALLGDGGMGLLALVYGFSWAVALLVTINGLPVLRLGRILRVSSRADVLSALLVWGRVRICHFPGFLPGWIHMGSRI